MKPVHLLLLSVLIGASVPAQSQSAYCGPDRDKMANVGDSGSSILMKCGEPMRRQYTGTTCSFGIATANCRPVETWTYNQGSGQFLKIMVLSGDRLIAIKDGDRAP